jgi:hypothetical protein
MLVSTWPSVREVTLIPAGAECRMLSRSFIFTCATDTRQFVHRILRAAHNGV